MIEIVLYRPWVTSTHRLAQSKRLIKAGLNDTSLILLSCLFFPPNMSSSFFWAKENHSLSL